MTSVKDAATTLVVPPVGAGTPFVLNRMDTGPLVTTLTVSWVMEPTKTSGTPRGPVVNPESGRRVTEVEVAGGGEGGGAEGGEGGVGGGGGDGGEGGGGDAGTIVQVPELHS